MRNLSAALVIMLVAGVAIAQVFPPKVGSEYVFAFIQPCAPLDAGGVPIEPQGVSVSIDHADTGISIACVAVPLCDQRIEANISLADAGVRQEFRGVAWTEHDCTGDASEASVETAYTYPGQKPGRPRLAP
jgi:hypothetical protein